ncbi:hypothetical protein Tco_0663128 [Tanacetum coccineum]
MTLSPSSFCKRYRSSYETPSSSPSLASSLTLPIRNSRPTWVDPKDGTVYIDIDFDAPPVCAPVQTPVSPKWSFSSLPISLASFTIPSPVASPMTTPVVTIAVEENEFLEGMGQDITELYDRPKVVRGEIHSHCFRLGSLKRGYEDQRETHDLKMQHASDQRKMQGLRERIATLERMMDCLKR